MPRAPRRPPSPSPPPPPPPPPINICPADQYTALLNAANSLKRNYDQISDTVAEQDRQLIRVEDAARKIDEEYQARSIEVRKNYNQALEHVKSANMRRRDVTREMEGLKIQLTEARNQTAQAEARLVEVTREKDKMFDQFQCFVCMERVADMVSSCGHCFCENCWKTWADASKFVWRDHNHAEQNDKMTCPKCRKVLRKTGDTFRILPLA